MVAEARVNAGSWPAARRLARDRSEPEQSFERPTSLPLGRLVALLLWPRHRYPLHLREGRREISAFRVSVGAATAKRLETVRGSGFEVSSGGVPKPPYSRIRIR
jgi:hypothetical protein